MTIFYGWVSQNEPERDPCRCGSPGCRNFIHFDLTDDDVRSLNGDGPAAALVRQRLEAYGAFLASIGQEHVETTIADTLHAMRSAQISRP